MQIDDVVHYSPVLSSSISHDGRWVVIASPKYDPTLPKRPVLLSVMDLDGDQKWKPVFPGMGVEAIYSPAFSSDNKRMLVFRFSNALVDAAIGPPSPSKRKDGFLLRPPSTDRRTRFPNDPA